jgi:repressor LexA
MDTTREEQLMKENINLAKYIGNKIKNYRESFGLTQDQLAEKLDTTKQTVSRWEIGQRSPKQNSMFMLSNLFNVSMDDFYPIEENMNSEMVDIPLYGSVAAGALAEVEGVTPDVSEYIQIPIQVLGKYANDKGLFAMHVNGVSMDKIIPHGSYVIAKKQPQTDFKDGDLVIFSHDNGYSLKRFLPHAIDGSILFKSESNDNRIKDIVVPFETCNDLKIHARVIWYSITLD